MFTSMYLQCKQCWLITKLVTIFCWKMHHFDDPVYFASEHLHLGLSCFWKSYLFVCPGMLNAFIFLFIYLFLINRFHTCGYFKIKCPLLYHCVFKTIEVNKSGWGALVENWWRGCVGMLGTLTPFFFFYSNSPATIDPFILTKVVFLSLFFVTRLPKGEGVSVNLKSTHTKYSCLVP